MAIHAGMAKMVIPSGIPCEKYKTTKVTYRKSEFSERDGRPLALIGPGSYGIIQGIFD
jgi:hypothetical protein